MPKPVGYVTHEDCRKAVAKLQADFFARGGKVTVCQ